MPMPPQLKVCASGARPPAEPLHPVLPNSTENPVLSRATSMRHDFTTDRVV